MARAKATKRSGGFVSQFYVGSKRVRKQGFKTMADATAFKVRVLAAVEAGVPIEMAKTLDATALTTAIDNRRKGVNLSASSEWTVARLAKEFIDELPLVKSRASKTILNYEEAFRVHINPVIGDLTLSQFTDWRVVDRVRDTMLAGGLKATTAASHLGKLRTVCDWAVKRHLMARNVARESELPQLSKDQKQERFHLFSHDEVGRLIGLAATPGRDDYDEVLWETAVYTYSVTGLRLSELLNLRWDDVEEGDLTLRVSRAKTAAGVRTVSVSAGDMAMLTRLKDRAMAGGGFVFSRSNGALLTFSSVQERFRKWSADLGVRYWPHGLRHYHASNCIAIGMDWKALQTRLGHEKIEMTMNIYGHLRPGYDREAATRASDGLRLAMLTASPAGRLIGVLAT